MLTVTLTHMELKKLVMNSLHERDYAAQETIHHLLPFIKLHSLSFKVMPVSLNISATAEEGESCTDV